MRTTIKATTALVLVLSLGLHWALLQTVAWTGMIVSYSQKNSLSDAVRMTFDGQHPCPMCKVIKQARADQKQQEQKQSVKPGSKSDFGLVWHTPAFDFTTQPEPVPFRDSSSPARFNAPPKPPPRLA